ncbi:hypothetical protein AVEN_58969-1 [Araneus ventricosus]|uniref:Secreted protein n=1 Tax=Araneus ventricosus TaxID=182803 RepID=A0A4Y2GUI3_ARAVE|nr:hypothetical protein AVEN_58969-1 [Araneus ventricosus]
MRSRRISKRVLASLVDIVMVWGRVTSTPMAGRTCFGRGWAVAGDQLLGLRPSSWCRSIKNFVLPTGMTGVTPCEPSVPDIIAAKLTKIVIYLQL